MVFQEQTPQGKEEVYLPLETGDVSQFAFAAFSRVAAGHKVNSSWGRMCVKGANRHETFKTVLKL